MLGEAARRFPGFLALHITATPETLAGRLKARGRESFEEIERRLARGVLLPQDGVTVLTIFNDGALDATIKQSFSALADARAEEIGLAKDA